MTKTQIFNSYSDFLNRPDKEVNGVSKDFAEKHPNFKKDNKTNTGCWNCSSCHYCSDCRSCHSCRSCSDCSDCSSCHYCSSCRSCRSCSSCHYCSGFKINPERLVSPLLGSRESQTTYYFTAEKGQIVCGCFTGTLQEFKNKVVETHGDSSHAENYLKWVAAVEYYVKTLHG